MYNFPIFVEDLLVHSEIKSNQINTNTMKIKHLFLSVLAMASVAVACNTNEDPSSDKPSLTLNPTELTFEIAGGTQTVAVEVKKTFTVTQNGEGGEVAPVEEGDGSKEKPYSATQALAVTSALEKDTKTDKE